MSSKSWSSIRSTSARTARDCPADPRQHERVEDDRVLTQGNRDIGVLGEQVRRLVGDAGERLRVISGGSRSVSRASRTAGATVTAIPLTRTQTTALSAMRHS